MAGLSIFRIDGSFVARRNLTVRSSSGRTAPGAATHVSIMPAGDI